MEIVVSALLLNGIAGCTGNSGSSSEKGSVSTFTEEDSAFSRLGTVAVNAGGDLSGRPILNVPGKIGKE